MAHQNDKAAAKKSSKRKNLKTTTKKQSKIDSRIAVEENHENEFEDSDYDEFDQHQELADEEVTEKKQHKSRSSSTSSFSETSFFYTSDKFFNTFEDDEIIYYIQRKYPTFDFDNSSDTIMRKTIIEILNDTKFMTEVLERYNMNIYDFFKFLFRYDQDIFKGLFFKRIKKALKYKKYAIAAKRLSYSARKQLSKKKLKFMQTV